MDQRHAHCSLRPLAALLIVFIFFIGLSCNLVQAESLLNALSLFAALTSSRLFMDVNSNDKIFDMQRRLFIHFKFKI